MLIALNLSFFLSLILMKQADTELETAVTLALTSGKPSRPLFPIMGTLGLSWLHENFFCKLKEILETMVSLLSFASDFVVCICQYSELGAIIACGRYME